MKMQLTEVDRTIDGVKTRVVTMRNMRKVYHTECEKYGLLYKEKSHHGFSISKWHRVLGIFPINTEESKNYNCFKADELKIALDKLGWIADEESNTLAIGGVDAGRIKISSIESKIDNIENMLKRIYNSLFDNEKKEI